MNARPASRADQALALLRAFAERTGLTSARPPDRYLWTEAFAVYTVLGLGQSELALRLVDQVHNVLGRYGAGDSRQGWISGLGSEQGERHPTRGGLRIGKPHEERAPDEPLDANLEWDRDGQYFHYLTKWMHALDQAARWTGQPRFNTWARELAETAHRAFTYSSAPSFGGPSRRMSWKMSVDLSRPLVPSMGHHDPLDGHITCLQLEATARLLPGEDGGPDLTRQTADFASMIRADLSTPDPLGIGGMLADAWRVEQLTRIGGVAGAPLRDRLLDASLEGLVLYAAEADLALPAARRLAFRELGLAMGLAAVGPLRTGSGPSPTIDRLAKYLPLRAEIERFWLRPEHRRTAGWLDHENINDVMLAASLAPDGFLTLRAVDVHSPPASA